MNSPKLCALPASELQRPPAVGKEVRSFWDTDPSTHRTMEHYKSDKEHQKTLPRSNEADPNSSPNPSPQPAIQWAQSLQCLLDDHQGVDLFREFLKQEGHETRSLDFRFGALGLQMADPSDIKKLEKMINVLYQKMVRKIPSISQGVKDEIKRKLSSGEGIDAGIFDAARMEVEDYMLRTTYPNFLNSDLYIQQLQPNKARDYAVSPEDQLPTLHEDKEMNFPHAIKKLFMRGGPRRPPQRPMVKSRIEATPAFLNSPSAPYHTKYAPFLPASARDSELQSMSSDVQTDDTMSQANSSVAEYPLTRNKLKRPQRPRYPMNNVVNNDTLSQNNFIPRTQRPLPTDAIHSKPAEFAAILTNKLLQVLQQNKNKEKVVEKVKSIECNDSLKSDASPASKFLLYAPEEENSQAILDNHISMVFEETPTRSPPCATPPSTKGVEDCPRTVPPGRCSVDPNLPQDLSCGRTARLGQPLQFFGPFAGRFRQDPDARSNDSGALTDWISEDNLPQSLRNSDFDSSAFDSQARRTREKLKSKKLSTLTGSSSSCFDSGVSMANESSVQPCHQKVANWLEAKRSTMEAENERQGRTSPVPSRSSSSRRLCSSSSRSGVMEGSCMYPVGQQDPALLATQDTASNLREAKRILEDEARRLAKAKYISSGRSCHDAVRGKVSSRGFDAVDDGISHRKQSKKSSSSDGGASSSDVTIIGYSFGRDSVPYKSKLSGKNITLRQFKTHLNKRGNFRYFFKRLNDDFGTQVVLDEVTDDHEILPLWEGKVFCVIETMDDGNLMNDD